LGLALYGGLGLPEGITLGVARVNNKQNKNGEVLFFEEKYFRWYSQSENSVRAKRSTAPHIPA
tara:strand:- start:991 stop:1179 length:189 start_codon:yes stop_codon:yes gene_type:complete